MADEFDTFLARALAPQDRDPDRAFVVRVSAAVALDERMRMERRSIIRQLGAQVVGLMAVAVAVLVVSRSPEVALFFTESRPIALAGLLGIFALLVVLMVYRADQPARPGTNPAA